DLRAPAFRGETSQSPQRGPGTGQPAGGQVHLHALAVPSYAEAVARRCGASVDTAHLAGLLHDIGKLVLPVAFGESESESIALEFPNGALRAAAERERLGVDPASPRPPLHRP